jgi:hypothetical protein
MRTFQICLTVALAVASAQAQDVGMQAAQSATMAAQQAGQQASWNMQMASQAAQNMMNAQDSSSFFNYRWPFESRDHRPPDPAPPAFSVGSGTYSSPVTLTINSSNDDVNIYYTTDGWTPTEYSTRYSGPIMIDSSATVQAIAVSPWGRRSTVSEAVYNLSEKSGARSTSLPALAPGVTSNAAAAALASGKRLIPRGTPVPLVFAAEVSSKTAKVGDRIFLTLAQDLESNGVVVAKQGTSAVAVITEVVRAHRLGAPGEVAFKLESLRAGTSNIKLRGGAGKQGQDQREKADTRAAFGLFVRGKDARIDPGTKFTAVVASDTALPAN